MAPQFRDQKHDNAEDVPGTFGVVNEDMCRPVLRTQICCRVWVISQQTDDL